MNFIEELDWRGMIHDKTPGIEEHLQKGMALGYVGFDPTASSLTIGNMVPVMMLVHFQRCGHKPIALVGGATGMVGDPSGKSEERKLLDLEQIEDNVNKQKAQLESFLDFNDSENGAVLVNNLDWLGKFGYLEFLRDVGKHLTINYMMSKDSVKSRMDTGMSFTEFSYQLLQGYDFYHLSKERNCTIQMGGSDQWGNIVTGMELTRRMSGDEVYGVTCPLLTKSDGSKFGKSEQGNIWLDGKLTSPFKFYQFWINGADDDIINQSKIFSLLSREELEAKIKEHEENAGRRILQQHMANEMTERLHGKESLEMATTASSILFGKSVKDDLLKLREEDFPVVFEGVGSGEIGKSQVESGIHVADFLVEVGAFGSKGEVRRMINDGGLRINLEKCTSYEATIGADDLLKGQFVIVQKGKKKFHIVYVK